MYTFHVVGEPASQGSKTRTRYGMKEASAKVRPWRNAVVAAVQDHGLAALYLNVPLSVSATFYFDRPKSHFGTGKNAEVLKDSAPTYVARTPDIDKCLRSTFDGLTESGMIKDDSLIVQLRHIEQRYRIEGDPVQGATITIREQND